MSHRQLYSEKKSDINVYDLATLLYCEKQENIELLERHKKVGVTFKEHNLIVLSLLQGFFPYKQQRIININLNTHLQDFLYNNMRPAGRRIDFLYMYLVSYHLESRSTLVL